MLREFPTVHTAGISSLASFQDSTLCVTSLDDTLSVYNLKTGKPMCEPLKAHSGAVNCCLFLQDGNRLLTASDDRTVLVWDQRNGMKEPVFVIKGFGEGINKMCTSSDGTLLYSACDSGLVFVHRLDDDGLYSLKYRFMASSQPVNDMACVQLADGRDIIVTACDDHAIRTWKTGPIDEQPEGSEGEDRMIQSIEEFEDAVNHVQVSGSWVYAASTCAVIGLQCDLSSGELTGQTRAYACHQDYVRGCRFFQDASTGNEHMLTVSDDKTAIEWDVVSGQPLAGAQLHNDFIMAMAVNSDATRLYTGCEDGTVREWNLPLPRNEEMQRQFQQMQEQQRRAEEEQDENEGDDQQQQQGGGDDEDDAAPSMAN